jgi:hypothetical protein
LQKKLEDIEFADDVWLPTEKRTPCAEEITKTGGRIPKNRVESEPMGEASQKY